MISATTALTGALDKELTSVTLDTTAQIQVLRIQSSRFVSVRLDQEAIY